VLGGIMEDIWTSDFYVFSGGVYLGIAWFLLDVLMNFFLGPEQPKNDPTSLAIEINLDDAEKSANSERYRDAYLSLKSAYNLHAKRCKENSVYNNPFKWR
jgi:hypothetical protein